MKLTGHDKYNRRDQFRKFLIGMVDNVKKNIKIFSTMMVTICLPITVIFSMFSVIMLTLSNDKGSLFYENISLQIISALLGLAGIVFVFILTARRISKKIEIIDDLTREMLLRNTTTFASDSNMPKLDQIIENCTRLKDRIDLYLNQASSLSEGQIICNESDELNQFDPESPIISIGLSLALLLNEIKRVSESIEKGDYSAKCSEEQLSQDFKEIIININRIIDALKEKIEFYEAVFDVIPFPIHVMNNDMKWLYMNKGLEEALHEAGFIAERGKYVGMDCCNANNPVCNTDECGIRQSVEKGINESTFMLAGQYVKLQISYLLDKSGNQIGYVEVCTDITDIVKVNEYIRVEVDRFERNLLRLAEGNLDFDLNIVESEKHTEKINGQFLKIKQSLMRVKESMGGLISEVSMITSSAIEGKLEARADETKFNGAWQDLIIGMNNILREIEMPIVEIKRTIDEMSHGNLNVRVTGMYKGEFERLKNTLNSTSCYLNTIVNDISMRLKHLADGNLDIDRADEYQGDFLAISHALNTIVESLNKVIMDIRDGAEQVTSDLSQISDSTQSQAQGVTEQASSIEELTASISEIADQTKQTALNANNAKEVTKVVMDNAEKGNRQMIQMQKSMTAINQSSAGISKIIKVIDDIAFQTNILALNAAVEAARAGQHGRGFAVVAEEVRTLAARSSEAAKQTTVLIEGSITKAQEGTKIADDTAVALNDIVGGIEKVTVLVSNIANATNEQATAISQFNTGIDQVAQVIQQNSATAEESAAASQELFGQAERLKQSISQFELR